MSKPSDPFEREADRVADRVMRMTSPTVARTCNCKDDDTVARSPAGTFHDSISRARLAVPTGSSPLPESVRTWAEPALGANLSGVRVHTGATADRSARNVNARAYTLGSDIVFARNQFQPETHAGRRLLAHEMTHALQPSPAIQLEPFRCPTGACHGPPEGTRRLAPDRSREFVPGAASESQELNVMTYLPDDGSREFGSYLLRGWVMNESDGTPLESVIPVLRTPYAGMSEVVGYILYYGHDNLGHKVTITRYGEIVDVESMEAGVISEGLGPLEWAVPSARLAGFAARSTARLGTRTGSRWFESKHIGAAASRSATEKRIPWFNPRDLRDNCVGGVCAMVKTRATKTLYTEVEIAQKFGETSKKLTGRKINFDEATEYFERSTGKTFSNKAVQLDQPRLEPGTYVVFGGSSTKSLEHVAYATVKKDGRVLIYDPQDATKPSWFSFLRKWGRGSRAYQVLE